jgi:5'(3')-deoxyribonucleotidase
MEIRLDLDGVVANFVKASQQLFSMPIVEETTYDHWVNWGISSNEFWHKVNTSKTFWEDIEPFDDFRQIVQLVESYDPNYKFLSSPSNSPNCYSGKYRWVDSHFGFIKTSKRLILASDKSDCASEFRLLIDDNDNNVRKWIDAGGLGFLWPQPYNENKHIENKIETLTDFLELLQTLENMTNATINTSDENIVDI